MSNGDDTVFSKHYIPSKKEGLKVKFNDKTDVKLVSIQKDSMETMEVRKSFIEKLTSFEEIDKVIDQLLRNLNELAERKIKHGYDVSYEFDLLKFQVDLLYKQKEIIQKRKEQREIEDIKNLEELMNKENELEKKRNKIEIQETNKEIAKLIGYKEKNEIANEKKQSDHKREIFQYLDSSVEAKNLDIVLLIHNYDITEANFNHLIDKLKLNLLIRFAISTYSYDTKTFKTSTFKNHSLNYEKKIPLNEVHNEIANFDWDTNSICLVLNVTEHLDKKKLDHFLDIFYSEDDIRQKLDQKDIILCYDSKCLWDITSQSYLSELILLARINNFNQKLSFLKRHNIKTFQELFELSNKTISPNFHYDLAMELKDLKNSKCAFFTKNSLKDLFQFKENRFLSIKLNHQIISQSKYLYLSSGERVGVIFESNKTVWIEIFENEKILINSIDIYLSAKLIINEFNTIFKDKIFKMNEIYKLDHKKYSICVIETNIPLIKSRMSLPDVNVLKKMACLTHFSYEYTNKQLILIDLRPIKSNEKILLTDPVIYSCQEDRFGSSNLGILAIQKFKSEHDCNEYCERFKLKKL